MRREKSCLLDRARWTSSAIASRIRSPTTLGRSFEFIADGGSVNEVDLMILAPGGFYLIEIKSRPGVIEGAAHTWTWRDQGQEHLVDNPLLLVNRKATRLISLLRQQRAIGKMKLNGRTCARQGASRGERRGACRESSLARCSTTVQPSRTTRPPTSRCRTSSAAYASIKSLVARPPRRDG